jgi:hypothetical protein
VVVKKTLERSAEDGVGGHFDGCGWNSLEVRDEVSSKK